MFGFIKKIFGKEEKIDTSNFLFINDNDLKKDIVIDKKYNKELLIKKINEVIEKNNIDIDIFENNINYFALVYYKAVKEIQKEFSNKIYQELGKKITELTDYELDEISKFEVYLNKHFDKLFEEVYIDGNMKDKNKDYVYKLEELANIKNIVDTETEIYFKDKWSKFLEINEYFKLEKQKLLKNKNSIDNNNIIQKTNNKIKIS